MTISDIQTEARALVDADSTSYTDALLLIRENNAYEEIVSKILSYDGKWQFDDSNYTDFPVGTTTLVNSQSDYPFDSTVLEVERVEVLDEQGIWQELRPIDESEIEGAISEFEKTDGLPIYYDKKGSSVILYPAPDNGVSVTLASGLKVYYKRTASIFTSAEVSTGTKTPGFASPFHVLIAYKAALPYAQSYKKDRVPMLINEINRLEKDMETFYSRREQDRRKGLGMAGISHR